MPEISFFSLLDKIKNQKEQFPFTVLYGFNEYLGEIIIRALSNQFLEEKNNFNFRRYYFDIENESDWLEIITMANSSNFFIESRKIVIVVIRDHKKITLNKTEKDILNKYLKNPNPHTILVTYLSLNISKDDFKQLKRQKIQKTLKEMDGTNVYLVNLDKIYERDVKQYIKNALRQKNITITESALEKIIEMKGDDFPTTMMQLPKLEIAASKGGGLDSEDIEKIITGIEAHSIWDLTDAIEHEDTKKYLQVLNFLFINGIKPSLIIGTLITHYNKIFTAKFLLKHKFPINDIGKVLNQPSFFLNKFIQSVRNFSEKRIKEVIDIIYKLDYESKTSGEDSAKLSLQNFIFKIKLLTTKN